MARIFWYPQINWTVPSTILPQIKIKIYPQKKLFTLKKIEIPENRCNLSVKKIFWFDKKFFDPKIKLLIQKFFRKNLKNF